MNLLKNIKSIELTGKQNQEVLTVRFHGDSTHKRQKIMSKLSGKKIQVNFEKETLPDWMDSKEFNEKFPIGTNIKYYPIQGRSSFKIGKTTTPAWELGHGATVVTTDIMGGGLLLTHLEIIEEDDGLPF